MPLKRNEIAAAESWPLVIKAPSRCPYTHGISWQSRYPYLVQRIIRVRGRVTDCKYRGCGPQYLVFAVPKLRLTYVQKTHKALIIIASSIVATRKRPSYNALLQLG